MGTIFNSNVFKGVSIAGKIVKGMAKNGVVFFGFHSHTIRILNRANEIGAVPDTDLVKFDAYVRSMVDFWVNYCDVFYRFRGTGDVNFKRINLANPEGSLADFYGGYYLDNSGIKGNGVNAYVDSNFNPSLLVSGQKYQLDDASRGMILTTTHTGGKHTLDGLTITSRNILLAQLGTTARINQGTASLLNSLDFTGIGLKILNRTDSLNVNGINENNQLFSTRASSMIENSVQLIMNRTGAFGDSGFSCYFMGKSIPFALSQEIRNHENADMTNLGITPIA